MGITLVKPHHPSVKQIQTRSPSTPALRTTRRRRTQEMAGQRPHNPQPQDRTPRPCLHGSVQPAAPHPAVPSPTFSSATPRIRQRAHVEWIRLPGRGGTAHSITHQAVHAASTCGRWYPPHPPPFPSLKWRKITEQSGRSRQALRGALGTSHGTEHRP